MAVPANSYILKLSCPDQPGIVNAVSAALLECGANIVDSAQFGDRRTAQFFMRTHFQLLASDATYDDLCAKFEPLAQRWGMQWQIGDASHKPRVLLMVSRFGHCLNDLLFRYRTGQLNIEIPAIVSNHKDFYQLAASYNIPYHHFPLLKATPESKAAQEAKIWDVIQDQAIDLVVLARYMQVLSADMCEKLAGRAINIHHSFLPSFKGAGPYQQAYDRGVKLIGATAHYVTTDLDEGPIIEQAVERVDHAMDPDDLTMIGRDVECVALSRAVKWHLEHRVIINGHRTVVFR
ncbi:MULTISPECIES: formyltetrahydrofolate deformylase [Paraburkholderia]|uniref:formyltetrahydrofolate deformylase n=1 Tax=Paraburkholderia TaxID=1822464 RepID=UPI00224F612C|nr:MULTISPECIES: formyltetrahydrofolate deformylase [Paraburkholderia]MCX4160043.1 formyltetrahydrofolate deformylase [Paraburkholderia megapolitana]MDN7155543.1 formyltetrahydrofolate deformylase [Paraburkholderia sp. CHISQ3]MDQ6492587.1 formyltetrahydrofolate deformylase [Paraburkholderia megapolitana]